MNGMTVYCKLSVRETNKNVKKSKKNLRDRRSTNKNTTVCITYMPERDERNWQKTSSNKYWLKDFPNLEK